jgi:hypothetical protein
MTARALACWVCLSSAVLAAPPDGGVDEVAEGKRHFVQGVALYNDANFNAALAEFEAASRAHHEPVVRYNIALCQKGLFRYAESIETLRAYLGEVDPKSLPPQRKAEVEQMISEMTALLVELPLTLVPETASLIVDGRATAGGKLVLAAGHHVLELSADGYKPLRREIELFAGIAAAPLAVTLEALPRTGRVHLSLLPASASVRIDGKAQVPRDVELPTGGHTVEVAAPGYLPKSSEITVAAGQARDLKISLDRKPPVWTKWWFWTAAVAVLGGVATAIAVPLSTKTESPVPGTIDTRPVP